MSRTPDPFVASILARLAPLGPIHARAMFGGHGIYLDAVMFAIVFRQTLWLRVDGETKARFAAAGGRPFVYAGKTKPVEMPYWQPPPGAVDDPGELLTWADLALAAATRAKRAKAQKFRSRRNL